MTKFTLFNVANIQILEIVNMRGLLEAVVNLVCSEPALCRLGQANTMQGESPAKKYCAGTGGGAMQGLRGNHAGKGSTFIYGQGPCRGSHLPLAAG